MNIDNLIQQLIELKSKGAETVYVLDTTWNDYELDHVTTDATGRRALIFVNVEDDTDVENELPWPLSRS